MAYALLKLAHLVFLVLWIGPPLGAYVLLARAYGARDPARIRLMERETERVLALEHVAFVGLLSSGAAMILVAGEGALAWPWLRAKLWAVAGIAAFELFDVWIAHGLGKRVFSAEDPRASPEWERLIRLRKLLGLCAVPVVVLLVPAALYLAVVKPP